MKKEEMNYLFEIAKSTGAKNVHWSGLTKKEESQDFNQKKSEETKLSTC